MYYFHTVNPFPFLFNQSIFSGANSSLGQVPKRFQKKLSRIADLQLFYSTDTIPVTQPTV